MESVKRFVPINFDLIGNPINWIIIMLMVVLGALMISLVFHSAGAVVANTQEG